MPRVKLDVHLTSLQNPFSLFFTRFQFPQLIPCLNFDSLFQHSIRHSSTSCVFSEFYFQTSNKMTTLRSNFKQNTLQTKGQQRWSQSKRQRPQSSSCSTQPSAFAQVAEYFAMSLVTLLLSAAIHRTGYSRRGEVPAAQRGSGRGEATAYIAKRTPGTRNCKRRMRTSSPLHVASQPLLHINLSLYSTLFYKVLSHCSTRVNQSLVPTPNSGVET